MSHYEYFLIFLALAFCGYASYTDIKTQKIRNFCSLGLLYAGVLSQLMAWYLGTTTPFYILGLFFGSGLIAFSLYWFGVFSPGDSKFFWGLCLMFPLSLFRNLSGALSFPPLVLALNIIVPYSIGILGYLLFKFVLMRNKLDILRYFFKSSFQKATLLEKLMSLLLFIGIGSGLTYLLKLFEWEPDRPSTPRFGLSSVHVSPEVAVAANKNACLLHSHWVRVRLVSRASGSICTGASLQFRHSLRTVSRGFCCRQAIDSEFGWRNLGQCS